MLDSKTRAYLRAEASKLDPVVFIGKDGIGENLLMQIEGVLDTRELIKITILQNSDVDAKTALQELANLLKAEPVTVIGKKLVLYRYSRKCKNHILDNIK